MASPKKLTLKLLVDNEKKRVVFAEADKDFVDILFSFLTMPVGNIIRLLHKKTLLGCMDKLYESVEKLDNKYFQTEACKTMLLHPLSASGCRGSPVEDLVLRIDDSNPRKFYKCRKPECCINKFKLFSCVQNTRCGCGEIMESEGTWAKKDWKGSSEDGVFVKGAGSFMVTDDLQVMPSTTIAILNVLDKVGIKEGSSLEQITMDFGAEELLSLLRRSLLSKSPISGICFQTPDHMVDEAEISRNIIRMPKLEEDSAEESKKLKVKFLVCKSNNKVVYTETGSGFVDLIFSFLTFSLGSVLKLLDNYSSIGCVGNLYKSVENLSGDCMKSDECKSMLLAPKLAPFFGCSNSLLPGIEMLAGSGTGTGCYTCFRNNAGTVGSTACQHGMKHVSLEEMNPKRPASKEVGGGYAKEAMKFMITDELEVTPFSAFASIQTTKKLEVNLNSLEEREIIIGETEALDLLKSCLTSQTPLSLAYCYHFLSKYLSGQTDRH